jgi:hypothetical protein
MGYQSEGGEGTRANEGEGKDSQAKVAPWVYSPFYYATLVLLAVVPSAILLSVFATTRAGTGTGMAGMALQLGGQAPTSPTSPTSPTFCKTQCADPCAYFPVSPLSFDYDLRPTYPSYPTYDLTSSNFLCCLCVSVSLCLCVSVSALC